MTRGVLALAACNEECLPTARLGSAGAESPVVLSHRTKTSVPVFARKLGGAGAEPPVVHRTATFLLPALSMCLCVPLLTRKLGGAGAEAPVVPPQEDDLPSGIVDVCVSPFLEIKTMRCRR